MSHLKMLGILLVLVGAPALANADDKIALDQLPEKAKATVEKQVADGTFQECERETRKGKPVFECEFTTAKDVRFEIIVGEDGKLLDKRAD
jgi:hypothetical protein